MDSKAGQIAVPILVGVAAGALIVVSGGTAAPVLVAAAAASAGISAAAGTAAAMQQMRAADSEAEQVKAAAEGEKVSGKIKANEIVAKMRSTLSTQGAAATARGLLPGQGGTVDDLTSTTTKGFQDEARLNRLNMLQGKSAAGFQLQQIGYEKQAAALRGATAVGSSIYGGYSQAAALGSDATPKDLSASATGRYAAGSSSRGGPARF